MEDKPLREENANNLYRCPFCACCFCTDADLKQHMTSYGTLKTEHASQFKKAHGRLEHGSFSSSE